MNSHSRKGEAQVSVSDALQLMLMSGTFIVTLLALVVELIKNQQKNNRLSSGKLAVILILL
ncbi:putative holin-like toxin [Leuconostoc mesenteroides]|nr:putative holin-like toxin [Leuconostoc mesenteroides]